MGGTTSQERIIILEQLKEIISKYNIELKDKELRALMLWVKCNYSQCETQFLFEPGFWQEVNTKLYDNATRKDKIAAKLLSAGRIMLEVITEYSREASGVGHLPSKQREVSTEPEEIAMLTPGLTHPPGKEKGEGKEQNYLKVQQKAHQKPQNWFQEK